MQQFILLSWNLLEYKLMYYHPDKVHSSWHESLTIPDNDYDELENQYKDLARSLKVGMSVTEMVDFDFDRPSCKLVLRRLRKERR